MKTNVLIPLLAVAATSPLFANGGGYIAGVKSTGPFRPVNVENVEMVSEKLNIELQGKSALVSIVYELKNPGKAVTVEMGFPCSVAMKVDRDDNGKVIKTPPLPQLEGFSLTADGAAVKSELMKDHAKLPGDAPENKVDEWYSERIVTGWQVVKVPFAAGQTRTVAVKYRNPYFSQVDSMSNKVDTSAPSMRYLFSAAGLWSGPIKSGEVTVRATGVDPDVVSLSHAKRFKRTGNVWKWSFTDFEPTLQDDLEIIAGEHEFSQWTESETGGITYIMRGKSRDLNELEKSGRWFFHSKEYTATASSTLRPDGPHTYGPENLNDNQRESTWAEGAEGDGVGESLTLTMNQPQKVTRLFIHNGYPDKALFFQNNRVKKLAVSVNGGEPFMAELEDGRMTSQMAEEILDDTSWINLPKSTGPVETVKLTIKEVYRGTKFQDTCIGGVTVETQLTKAPPIFPSR
jgi:hypothetical protein